MNPITGMLEQAVEAYAVGDFVRAAKICDDVLKRDPSNSRAMAYRALANFERVIRSLGDHFTALTIISVALQRDISTEECRQHIKTAKNIWTQVVTGTEAFVASLTRGLGLDPALHHEFPPSVAGQYRHHWQEGIGKCLNAVVAQMEKLDEAESDALRERLGQIEGKFQSLVRRIETPPENLPDAVTDYSGGGDRDDDFPAFGLSEAGPAHIGDESHADLVSMQLTDDGAMLTGSEVQFVRFSGEAGPLTRLDLSSESLGSNDTLDVQLTAETPAGPSAEELAEQAAQRAAEKMREALDAERAKFDADRQRAQQELDDIKRRLLEAEARAKEEAAAADAARREAEQRAIREAEKARAAQAEAQHRAQLEIERVRVEQLKNELARLEAEKQAERERAERERLERDRMDRERQERDQRERSTRHVPKPETAFFQPPNDPTNYGTMAPGTAVFSPDRMAAEVAERVSRQIVHELAAQQKAAQKPNVAKTLSPDELAHKVAAVLAEKMRAEPGMTRESSHLTQIAARAAEAVPAKVADKMASDPALRAILHEATDPRLKRGQPPSTTQIRLLGTVVDPPTKPSASPRVSPPADADGAFFEPPRTAPPASAAAAPTRMVHPTPPSRTANAPSAVSTPSAPSPSPAAAAAITFEPPVMSRPAGPPVRVQSSVGADVAVLPLPASGGTQRAAVGDRLRFHAHDHEMPLESAEGETTLKQIRAAYANWIRERPGHPWPQAAEKMHPLALRRAKLYAFQLVVLYESREMKTGEGMYRDEPLPTVPISAQTANAWSYVADLPMDFRARHAVFRLPDSYRLINEDPKTGGRRLAFVELHVARRPHAELLVYPGELLPKRLDVEKLFSGAKIIARETFDPFLRGPDVDRLFPDALRPVILEMARQLRTTETDTLKIRSLAVTVSEAPMVRLAFRLPGAPRFKPLAGTAAAGNGANNNPAGNGNGSGGDDDAAAADRVFTCCFVQLDRSAQPGNAGKNAGTGGVWEVAPDGDLTAEYEAFLRAEAEWSAAHGRANRTEILTNRLLSLDPSNEKARELRHKIRRSARWDYVAGFGIGLPIGYGACAAVWHMAPAMAFAFSPFMLVLCGLVTFLLWRLIGVRVGSRPGRLILTALVVAGMGALSPVVLREAAQSQRWNTPNIFETFTQPTKAPKSVTEATP